jgi:dodecin
LQPLTGHSEAAAARIPEAPNMKDHVYKLIELTGTSTTSIEDAVDRAIKRAHKTIKNLCWFQVLETRGNINKGKVDHWQVTIKVGFTVEG